MWFVFGIWAFGFVCGVGLIVVMSVLHWWKHDMPKVVSEAVDEGLARARMDAERQRFQLPKP